MLTTRAELRHLLLEQQSLSSSRSPGSPVTWVVQQGFLQLDWRPHALASGHDLVLANRLQGYQLGDIDVALYNGGQIFEHCLHVPGVLPAAGYDLIRDPEAIAALARPGSLGARVLQLLASEGPLSQHELLRILQSEGWHERRNVEQTIHQLFIRGAILVRQREGPLRTYDLAERVLPRRNHTTLSTPERQQALALHALRVLAPVSQATWSQAINGIGSRAKLDLSTLKREKGRLITELVARGKAIHLQVEDPVQSYFVPVEWLSALERRSFILAPRVHFLSPIDPLVWDRQRTYDLFGFDCRRQVYAPADARRRPLSACILPVLYGEALVGRLEPRMSWASGRLLIEGIHLEDPTLLEDTHFRNAFATALSDLALLHGARDVCADGPVPPRLIP